MGLPRWLSGKESPYQCKRNGFDPWVGKIPWEEKMATHSTILAWKAPWTEEPGGLQSTGLQRVRHAWAQWWLSIITYVLLNWTKCLAWRVVFWHTREITSNTQVTTNLKDILLSFTSETHHKVTILYLVLKVKKIKPTYLSMLWWPIKLILNTESHSH